MNLHPANLLIWGAGLVALLAGRRFEPHRWMGVLFTAVLAILLANRTSRSSYLLPAYPMLFAAGGAFWEPHLRRPIVRVAAIAAIVSCGAVTLPLAVPVLPVDDYVRYSRALELAPATDERKALARLPQFFADRQGWGRIVDQVATAWDRLPEHERRHAAVLTSNYGEAGAIERLGASRGIRAISGHNSYWLWGPGATTGEVLIVLTRDRGWVDEHFASVERVGETDCGDCMPYENHLPILACRSPRIPLAELWPRIKHFD
jgi:hypothetical protein